MCAALRHLRHPLTLFYIPHFTENHQDEIQQFKGWDNVALARESYIEAELCFQQEDNCPCSLFLHYKVRTCCYSVVDELNFAVVHQACFVSLIFVVCADAELELTERLWSFLDVYTKPAWLEVCITSIYLVRLLLCRDFSVHTTPICPHRHLSFILTT